jgi:hypothetical protein
MPKTRKVKKANKTVPQIRKTLETIDRDFEESLTTDLSLEDRITDFMKQWKSKVGKTISYKMAKDYVELRLRAKQMHHKKRFIKTRRNRQKGGMAPLVGGPLDLTSMRPGVYGTYGNFLPYVTNDIRGFWSSGISADCGKIDNTPNPMAGGALLTPAPLIHPPSQNPTTLLNDAVATFKGQPFPGKTSEAAAPSSSVFQ